MGRLICRSSSSSSCAAVVCVQGDSIGFRTKKNNNEDEFALFDYLGRPRQGVLIFYFFSVVPSIHPLTQLLSHCGGEVGRDNKGCGEPLVESIEVDVSPPSHQSSRHPVRLEGEEPLGFAHQQRPTLTHIKTRAQNTPRLIRARRERERVMASSSC